MGSAFTRNTMIDLTRYWIAVLTIVTVPPAILYWLLIHPFAVHWRRLGRVATFTVVALICLAAVFGLWLLRDRLLGPDLGFHPALAVVGLGLYLWASWRDLRIRRRLRLPILVGAPELARDDPGRMLVEGPYAEARHPRYATIVLAFIGIAMIANHVGVWLLLPLTVLGLWLVVVFEERELLERFGDEYRRYAERVPRFIPRRRRA
jgi:protein-S-isoprenylcysteine O-methyltransferase Ste14